MENILEWLLPLILIGSFFSMRNKKKKKDKEKRAQGEAETPEALKKKSSDGGVFGKLNKMMEDYYASDLKGAPQKKTKDSWAGDPLEMHPPAPQTEPEPWEDDEDDFKEKHSPAYQTQPHPAKPKPDPVTQETTEIAKPDEEAIEETEIGQTAPSIAEAEMQISRKTTSYNLSDMKTEDLRRAVVWSEILGPPKALRDD